MTITEIKEFSEQTSEQIARYKKLTVERINELYPDDDEADGNVFCKTMKHIPFYEVAETEAQAEALFYTWHNAFNLVNDYQKSCANECQMICDGISDYAEMEMTHDEFVNRWVEMYFELANNQ